ncbi:uncharacterized protein LOC106173228 [Lingula anatina]|uniref:Uncharacterized protein LOC106170519 n=1 Tax=Lingula anatina TaxID=7574 RepID=A0A1S3J6C1_LINAN|nr:uncharacterized protein LOC106170519 [Lingula anatina]XP_013405865.1 uncharacterized protein LOC106170519 [Lingula anatina]XP_013409732.1 uncharacterized protein LOC106173228 [Lingula anatina]|eukprot:XP_013405858.1 uncharacterized protein LOC106170519 [Lingula anatina]
MATSQVAASHQADVNKNEGRGTTATVPTIAKPHAKKGRLSSSCSVDSIHHMHEPTDHMLLAVTNHIFRKNWHSLGEKLGFTPTEMKKYEDRYPTDEKQPVFLMLRTWRDRQGESATTEHLEDALASVRLSDVAEDIHELYCLETVDEL